MRALAPAALGACATADDWRRLHDRIIALSGNDDILLEPPLPAARDGRYPEPGPA
ncbi:MAG: hypothetical protein M3Q65_19230 [Chloroflexota bacterium]|nr:hypothetical protein [Chloroflexota bacterium]